MRIFKVLSALILLLLSNTFFLNSQNQKQIVEKKTAEVTFNVNMHCENCKAKIEKNISWEKGVKDLSVNLENKTVRMVDEHKNDECVPS